VGPDSGAERRAQVLSYSPGGGNSPENGSWVAAGQLATMCPPPPPSRLTPPRCLLLSAPSPRLLLDFRLRRGGGRYRIVTDFHGGWGALQQNIFAAGNFTVKFPSRGV
jgi:hypothetical protein